MKIGMPPAQRVVTEWLEAKGVKFDYGTLYSNPFRAGCYRAFLFKVRSHYVAIRVLNLADIGSSALLFLGDCRLVYFADPSFFDVLERLLFDADFPGYPTVGDHG